MKAAKIALKIVVSLVIIVLVIRKIDLNIFLRILSDASPLWLLCAVLMFVLSKIVSAFRFNTILASEHIYIESKQNIRFYWLGMYYNLLLPGGISGDGYKIKVISDSFILPLKRIFKLVLLDRISGLIALWLLLLTFIPFLKDFGKWWWLAVIIISFSVAASWYIYKYLSQNPEKIWLKTSLQSLAVQLFQLISVFFIIASLKQELFWLGFVVLFLISSVVAQLPLTIGGAGAREITFLYGGTLLGLDNEKAVAIAFLFYIISTIVSLYGLVYSLKGVKIK